VRQKVSQVYFQTAPGRTLNVFEKLTHDIVEQLDLIFGESARSKNKEVGHSSQNLSTPRNIFAGR